MLRLIFAICILLSNSCMLSGARMNEHITVLLKPTLSNDVLDPSYIQYTADYFLLENLTLRLIGLSSKGLYENILAESVSANENKSIYTIKIKPAYFSNGEQITLKDVYYSIKRILVNGSTHSNIKEFLIGGDHVKTLDDDVEGLQIKGDSLIIKFKKSYKEFLYCIQMSDFGILHKTQYMKPKLRGEDWTKITSGPYSIQYDDNSILLSANKKALTYKNDIPQKVELVAQYSVEDPIKMLEAGKADMGSLPLSLYMSNEKRIASMEQYKVFATSTDKIVFLVLNPKSEKFKELKNRRWVQKNIINKFFVDSAKYKNYTRKAVEYFVPQSKAYLQEHEIADLVNSWTELKDTPPPEQLKDGINILTYNSIPKIFPVDILDGIKHSLKIPIEINSSLSMKEMQARYDNKEFDAFLAVVAMDYKAIGETLNLLYNSNNPTLTDIDGSIKKLALKYQESNSEQEEKSILRDIVIKMTEQSECVPLFYVAHPFFYNTKRLNTSDMNIFESLQIWKVHELK